MQIETEAAVCGDWSTRLLRRFQGGEQGGGLLSKKKQVTRGASKRAKQLFNSPARADTTYDKFANALEVMKKYPKEHKRFKEQLTLMRRNFNRLSKIINKEP
jgi:hypothetical protein